MDEPKVKTFEQAKQLSIKKWKSILSKLLVVSCDTGEYCGFCLLAQYKYEENDNVNGRCNHCLVIDKCNEYKNSNVDFLDMYVEFVESLIIWLEEFEGITK